ncbi:hypothetical protein ABIB57_004444 [Devosia sp. UYZn731]
MGRDQILQTQKEPTAAQAIGAGFSFGQKSDIFEGDTDGPMISAVSSATGAVEEVYRHRPQLISSSISI